MNNRTESIAGVLLGKQRDQVVVVNKDTGETETINVKGRNLYVRKLLHDEQRGGIFLPDESRENSSFGLVLAVGTECGKHEKATEAKRKRVGWMSSVEVAAIEPGTTKVLFPDDTSWGMLRSPFGDDEFFVNECHGVAIIED